VSESEAIPRGIPEAVNVFLAGDNDGQKGKGVLHGWIDRKVGKQDGVGRVKLLRNSAGKALRSP